MARLWDFCVNLTPTVVSLIGFVLPVVVSGYGTCLLPRWELEVVVAALIIIRSLVMSWSDGQKICLDLSFKSITRPAGVPSLTEPPVLLTSN